MARARGRQGAEGWQECRVNGRNVDCAREARNRDDDYSNCNQTRTQRMRTARERKRDCQQAAVPGNAWAPGKQVCQSLPALSVLTLLDVGLPMPPTQSLGGGSVRCQWSWRPTTTDSATKGKGRQRRHQATRECRPGHLRAAVRHISLSLSHPLPHSVYSS